MKMKKLGAIAASVACLGALALAGCSSSNFNADGVLNDGKLTVVTSAEYEPFEYMENKEYKGFDIDFARALADKLGLELQIENTDFDAIVTGVASGTKYDMGIAAITATPEREKEVDFTDSYYMDDQAIVTKKGNTAVTADNYSDELNKPEATLIVQSGSTAEAFAKENFPNATIKPYKNATDCFAALDSDQGTAVITNRSVAAQMVAGQFSGQQVIKQISTGEEYSIAVAKDNPVLKDKVNKALKELTDDGTVDSLMSKYNIK